MNISGLMAEAFKIFLGNSNIMVILLGWSIFLALIFTIKSLFEKTD